MRTETRNYKPLIRAVQNRHSGTEELAERSLARLKLEVSLAIDENFWGKGPPERPLADPGAGGFGNFKFGKGSQ